MPNVKYRWQIPSMNELDTRDNCLYFSEQGVGTLSPPKLDSQAIPHRSAVGTV